MKRSVDEAKERWILRVSREAESARKDGKQRWMSIRQLQMAYAVRRPTRSSALLRENGEMTCCMDEVKLRLFNHFSNVLNIPCHFKEEVISEIPDRPTELNIDDPPSCDDLIHALSKLKMGKAGWKTGILPELLLYGGAEVHERLLQIIQKALDKREVVKDWKDAEIVPIPKKGNLQHCDNLRGISLLDVVGKVFARILQERLQEITEKVLPDSQCGFRKGRGCVDMIFVARQLVEKTRERDDALFVLFVDLKKVYDSVLRLALLCVLEEVRCPSNLTLYHKIIP